MMFRKGDIWEFKWGHYSDKKAILMLVDPNHHGYECLFMVLSDPDGLTEEHYVRNGMKAHIRSLIAEDHAGRHWRKLT